MLRFNVAAGIYAAIYFGCFTTTKDKAIAASTADFFVKMNTLFDNLNIRSSTPNNPNSIPISNNSDTLQNIIDSRESIRSWESTAKMKRPYCFSGLAQTLQGIKELWENIKQEQPYLLTGYLNTDPQENLSSIIRMNRGSYERNPSSYSS